MSNPNVYVSSIRKAVTECCRGKQECGECKGKSCLVGYAKLASEYADVKKTIHIPNGIKLVPNSDFKIYDSEDIAHALAIINLECKNCMDNHDDNCVVNIARSALEVALFGQHFEFAGNPLMYMMGLSQANKELGDKVMNNYRLLKNA